MENFCDNCEALLFDSRSNCSDCGHKLETKGAISKTRVWFNKRKDLLITKSKDNDREHDGPRVDKFCNKCGQVTPQTYFTAQLRSADEGQTVFYRCTQCLIQTNENS